MVLCGVVSVVSVVSVVGWQWHRGVNLLQEDHVRHIDQIGHMVLAAARPDTLYLGVTLCWRA